MPARLFSMRPAPLRPIRRAIRSWRARPHRGLSGPLLLALALAGTGQYFSAQADASQAPVATVSTAAAAAWSAASMPDVQLLPEMRARRTVAKPVVKPVVKPKVAAAKAPVVRRTPQRATRSTSRATRTTVRAPRATGRWVRPCAGAMTSAYGQRWGRMHRGIDLCGRHGLLVVAAGDGVVISAGSGLSGYGNQIQIRHSDGSVSSYSHLSAFLVRGGRVSAGTPIGRTGSTGNVTGPHLHLEIKVGGVHVDPQSFLRRRGVSV